MIYICQALFYHLSFGIKKYAHASFEETAQFSCQSFINLYLIIYVNCNASLQLSIYIDIYQGYELFTLVNNIIWKIYSWMYLNAWKTDFSIPNFQSCMAHDHLEATALIKI